MSWEPEDGRCRECSTPLETDLEQLTGRCCFCWHRADEEHEAERDEEDDPIADFYAENDYF